MNSAVKPPRLALISVSDKNRIALFARDLVARGFTVLSTGGTADEIRKANVPVMEVADHTGFPEMMEG